jgi:hypothetical protein
VTAVNAEIPYEDDAAACHTSVLSMGALTALLQINSASQNLVLSNVGIGGTPLVLNIDSQEALRVELDTFGMTVDGQTGVVTMDTAFDLFVSLTNVAAFFEDFFDSTDTTKEGSVTVSMPAGTKIETVDNGLGETVGHVSTGGPLAVMGTDELVGDVSIAEDGCFTLFPDLMLFPIEETTCPE